MAQNNWLFSASKLFFYYYIAVLIGFHFQLLNATTCITGKPVRIAVYVGYRLKDGMGDVSVQYHLLGSLLEKYKLDPCVDIDVVFIEETINTRSDPKFQAGDRDIYGHIKKILSHWTYWDVSQLGDETLTLEGGKQVNWSGTKKITIWDQQSFIKYISNKNDIDVALLASDFTDTVTPGMSAGTTLPPDLYRKVNLISFTEYDYKGDNNKHPAELPFFFNAHFSKETGDGYFRARINSGYNSPVGYFIPTRKSLPSNLIHLIDAVKQEQVVHLAPEKKIDAILGVLKSKNFYILPYMNAGDSGSYLDNLVNQTILAYAHNQKKQGTNTSYFIYNSPKENLFSEGKEEKLDLNNLPDLIKKQLEKMSHGTKTYRNNPEYILMLDEINSFIDSHVYYLAPSRLEGGRYKVPYPAILALLDSANNSIFPFAHGLATWAEIIALGNLPRYEGRSYQSNFVSHYYKFIVDELKLNNQTYNSINFAVTFDKFENYLNFVENYEKHYRDIAKKIAGKNHLKYIDDIVAAFKESGKDIFGSRNLTVLESFFSGKMPKNLFFNSLRSMEDSYSNRLNNCLGVKLLGQPPEDLYFYSKRLFPDFTVLDTR